MRQIALALLMLLTFTVSSEACGKRKAARAAAACAAPTYRPQAYVVKSKVKTVYRPAYAAPVVYAPAYAAPCATGNCR